MRNLEYLHCRCFCLFNGVLVFARFEQDVSFVSLPLQHIKNSADTNKFDGWPDVLEMEGCVPQRAG